MNRGIAPILVILGFFPFHLAAQDRSPELVTVPRTASELNTEPIDDISEVEDHELDAMLTASELAATAREQSAVLARTQDDPGAVPTARAALADGVSRGSAEAEDQVATPSPAPEIKHLEVPPTPATTALLERVRTRALSSLRSIEKLRSVFAIPEVDMDAYFVLKPHVDDPRWNEAMALLVADDCKTAKTKAEEVVGPGALDDPNADPAVRYALARIDLCAGFAARGNEVLRELARGESAVADLARDRLGLPIDTSDENLKYVSAYLREAKAKGRRGEVDEALADLDRLHRELPSRWDRFRTRRTQAEILEDARRYEDAGEVYVALYRKSRGWKANADIEDRIERLERRAGMKVLTYGERIDRMRHLISRGRYGDARRVSIENAKIRGVSGNEIRGWSYYRRALQAEKKKDRKEAVELFQKAERLVKDDEVRPRLYFGWARALRRLDQDRKAIELYGRLCAEFSEHHLCDDARYESGRLLQYLEEHTEALAQFEKVLQKHNDSDWVADALWRSAFSHILLSEWDAAIVNLERLRSGHGDEQDASELTLGLKATYWMGVAHLKAGRTSQARALLQETVDRGRLTWYGRLAVTRLEEADLPHAVHLPDAELSEADFEDLAGLLVPRDPRLERAAEYARLGLWNDAEDEVKKVLGAHPVPAGAHRFLGALQLAQKDPSRAHWTMKKHIDEAGPNRFTIRDWGTAFPIDYLDLGLKWGREFGVSPFLVQAIIRQESGFRPHVRSWAGAVGLMQLMPGTARYTAQKFVDDTRYSRSHLTRPETNVKLGTMYIRLHTAHTNESIPLALAGYNAGPAPLKSWLQRYGDRELDAWVESITYREARGYVRKVYTSYITYSYLYGGVLPALKLDVPKKLREWGDIPGVDPNS